MSSAPIPHFGTGELRRRDIHSAAQLIALISEAGFLPLLNTGIDGWSADEVVSDDARYTVLPDGTWQWPLWEWKGDVIRDAGCAYGKFIHRQATFISRQWWPDFCNWRRSLQPYPAEDSIERAIIDTLREGGSMTTRELRRACGFTLPGMRSRFDGFITRLQMQTYIVTQDFVYPTDRNGHRYGWGWSLLTTPEALFGPSACRSALTPAASRDRILTHLAAILPNEDSHRLAKLL